MWKSLQQWMDNDRQQAKSLIVNWPLISFLLMYQLPNDGNISKDCQTNWLILEGNMAY
jgi:hypothetical protein